MDAHAKPGYPEALKKEPDRLVALAFCAADVLFEVYENRTINYAAGATQALTGYDPQTPSARAFSI